MTTPSICIVNPPWDKELTIIPNCACHITRIKTWLLSHTSFCCTLILIHWCSDLQKPHRLLESLMVIFFFLTILDIKIFSDIQSVELCYLYSALKSFNPKEHKPCKISSFIFLLSLFLMSSTLVGIYFNVYITCIWEFMPHDTIGIVCLIYELKKEVDIHSFPCRYITQCKSSITK